VKIQACMIAGYPAPYLIYSLRSIEKAVDCFLIVITEPFDYYDRESTAIVMENINKFKEETNKPVRLVLSQAKTLHEARQTYMDNLDRDTTHIFQIDSDEVYDFKDDDGWIKRRFETRPNAFMMEPTFMTYWKDVSHINREFDGNQGRIYKPTSGMHYEVNANGFERVSDSSGREMNTIPDRYPQLDLIASLLHHYAYAMKDEYIKVKLSRYMLMMNPKWNQKQVDDAVADHSFFAKDSVPDIHECTEMPSVLADKPFDFKGDY